MTFPPTTTTTTPAAAIPITGSRSSGGGVVETVTGILGRAREVYEGYTSPLGIGDSLSPLMPL